MEFYHLKTVRRTFEDTVSTVTEQLKIEGFGVLTRIDMKEKLKEKLGVEFRKYIILGACNPPFAYKALGIEDKIGVMLPCNVIVQEKDEAVEVATVNPLKTMAAVDNEQLKEVAAEVSARLARVLEKI